MNDSGRSNSSEWFICFTIPRQAQRAGVGSRGRRWAAFESGLGNPDADALTFRPVSKTAKSTPEPSGAPVPFEEALQKLEAIVEAMESGDLTLEQLLSRFEEGARLVRTCQTQLDAAEVRVQQLEKTLSGEWVARPVAVSGGDSDT
ncbi:MAG: exodeoxyribonuclease VII small subunit [Verrucomicrobiae bacterium]|nr:exodeoxyribonuclease VII small subunit [Verrucomicrobiae bacterium]